MKLQPSFVNPHLQEPQIRTVDTVTTATVAAICIASAFCIVVVAAVTCYIQRRRNLASEHHTTLLIKRPYERPLTLRKPTAVKSPGPSVGSGGIVLKKSPSPTGQKSPPGTCLAGKVDRRGSNSSQCSHTSSGSTNVTIASGITTDHTSTLLVSKINSKTSSPNAEPINELNAVHVQAEDCVESVKLDNVASQQAVQSRVPGCDISEEGKESTGRQLKLGQLHFRLKYNYEKHALCVTIAKCTELPPKESSSITSCDPYVKLQLLPDKQHKVKTRVLRKCTNPMFDEDFTFYGLAPTQLEGTVLHFVVLSFDRYSRDDIIGEVVFHLGHLEFDTLEKQVSLVREIAPRSLKIRSQGRGEVLVSLCHQPAANRLTVVVLKARNLPKMDVTGLCDPYVKIYLLYNQQRIAKKKTHVKKRTLSPVFNESFVFDVPYNEGLENLSLEFMLLDYERVTKNEVIGKLELGPSVAEGSAQKHWQDAAKCPRRQIAEWHKLHG